MRRSSFFYFSALFLIILVISPVSNLEAVSRGKRSALTLQAPNGNERIRLGSDFMIRWQPADFRGSLNIILQKGRRSIGTIARNVQAPLKQFKWRAGSVLGNRISPSGGYFILIESRDKKLYDRGNAPFTILPPLQSVSQISKPISQSASSPASSKPQLTFRPQLKMMTLDKRPDFLVDRFEIEPLTPVVGQPYKIKVYMKPYPDLGTYWGPDVEMTVINTQAPQFNIRKSWAKLKGKMYPTTPPLVFSFDAEPLVDIPKQLNKKVTVKFDIYNKVEERNESNNTASHQFLFYSPSQKLPDLRFHSQGSQYFSSESPNEQKGANEPVKCWGFIKNIGDGATTKPFSIKIEGDDDRAAGTKFTQQVGVTKILGPGEVYQFVFYHQWSTAGMKVMWFVADINNVIAESDEKNNTSAGFTGGLTVRLHN